MKKITIILAVLIAVVFLFTSCQKAKETEGKKSEVQVQQAMKEEVKQPLEKKQTIAPKTPFKRPAGCDEAYNKYLMKDYEQITEKEQAHLWDVCKIPISRRSYERLSVLKWWKDEYGYEDLIYESLLYYIKTEEYSDIKSEYIEPIKDIALNSKYPKLRERAIIVLHGIDKKRSIPILKEVLKREVEEREITNESRRLPIIWAGRLLSEEGEYEYAFPYLMKAKVFEISAERNDNRAIPFARKALSDDDESIRLSASGTLIRLGIDGDKNRVLNVLLNILENSKDGGYQNNAIFLLGNLRDKNALPALKKQLEVLDPKRDYKYQSVVEAIKKIEKSTEEK